MAGEPNFAATADLVLVVVGVRPETDLAVAAGAQTGVRGAIRVDRRMRTSLPDILAAGDCVETYHHLLDRPAYLPLGTTAHKQGRVAGETALGGTRPSPAPSAPRWSRSSSWPWPEPACATPTPARPASTGHGRLGRVRPQGLLPRRPPAAPAHHRRPPQRAPARRSAAGRPSRPGGQAHRHPGHRPVPPHARRGARRAGPELHPTVRQPLGRCPDGRPDLDPPGPR